MRTVPNFIPPQEFLDYVRIRGIKAEPIHNDIAAAQNGTPLQVRGYDLIGPRKNRKVVVIEQNGTLNLSPVKLWLDGIEYASIALKTQKMRKRGQL